MVEGHHIMNKMNEEKNIILEYLDNLCGVLKNLPLDDLTSALTILNNTLSNGRNIYLAGNGGSAATASHMANDLIKGISKFRGIGLRAVSLSDNIPIITAIANDEDYRDVFANQLETLGKAGDVLLAISGSGNSENIIRVIDVAKRMNISTIGFLGMSGGKVADMVDISVIVPSDEYGPIEDVHMVLVHLITKYLSSAPYG